MTLSKRQQIKASKIIDKWEGITGVDAINARQATTLQGVKDGLRADMTTFRHMYESADRAMSTLIDQLDDLDD